ALIPEEGAAAVPPQRVGVVRRHLRLWHRHLHRLVAGLRRRIFDRGEVWLLADLRQAVDGGAAAHEAKERKQRGELEDTETRKAGHLRYSGLAGTCAPALARAVAAAAGAAPSEEVLSDTLS